MSRDLPPTRPNPVFIEREFRTLLVRLSYPISAHRHLLEIDSFLDKILPEFLLYESYVLEVVQRIPDIVHRLNFPGIDPASLRPLYDKLKELIVRLPAISTVKDLSLAMQKFRSGLSRLYQFVGETNVGEEFGPENLPAIVRAQANRESESLLIPVVERSLVETYGSLKEAGYLRTISVKITGTARDADLFHAQVLVLGEGGRLANVLTEPVKAARSLLLRKRPVARNRFFTGYVTFDELNSFHQGSSAGLAIATLITCAILSAIGAREQYTPTPTVTTTGDINEEGEILAVDPDSVKLKTHAVFFSGIRYFVVPKKQSSIAQEIVDALHLRYPNRVLTIIGLSRLEDLFYDRRLTQRHYVGIVGQMMRKAWKNRVQLVGATAVIALLVALAKTLGPPQDTNPVLASLDGQMLQIKNSRGQTLDEIEVGSQTVARARVDRVYDASRICKFYDVDLDGKNEFIYLKESKRDTGFQSALLCRTPWRKFPRWVASFREEYVFPSNPMDTSEDLAIASFLIDDFGVRGLPSVVVAANHVQFPGLLVEIDGRTSRTKAQFLNTGHLDALATTDLDSNGRKELLVAGFNNAYNAAFLAVFDPQLIGGHSPWKGLYSAKGLTEGTEMYYVLIPHTIIGEKMPERSYEHQPATFEIGSHSHEFSLTVTDFAVEVADKPGAVNGTIRLTFDDSLRVLVSSNPTFDHFRDVLYTEGTVRRLADPAYLNGEFKESLLYWDGAGWRHEPTVNRNYLRALDILHKQIPKLGIAH